MYLVLQTPLLYQNISDHINSLNTTWTAQMTPKFLNMNKSQFNLPQRVFSTYQQTKTYIKKDVPASIDWTNDLDCTNEVFDQLNCNAGYAFAAVDQISMMRCNKGIDKHLTMYSVQDVLNCDRENNACQRGFMDLVEDFVHEYGLVTEKCIGYVSGISGHKAKCFDRCDDGSKTPLRVRSTSFDIIFSHDDMIQALQDGPIMAGVTVHDDFLYYEKGIYQNKYGENQGGQTLLIVGYGEEKGVKYWKVKNSWGETWGQHGYGKIIRGQNECQIENGGIAIDVAEKK